MLRNIHFLLKQLCAAGSFDDQIGRQQEGEVDNGIEQPDGRAEAVARFQNPFAVYVSSDHVSRFVGHRVVQKQYFLVANRHDGAHPQYEQNRNRRQNARDGNMQDPLEASRSVNLGRFVQGRIDARDRRQVNNRTPAYLLPNARGYVEKPEPFGLLQEQERLQTESGDDLVDQAVGGQEIDHHANDDDERNEMRQIRDRLHRPLEEPVSQLVQQQRQHDRSGKAEGDAVQAEQQRIAYDAPEVKAVKKIAEMPEPDPRAVRNAEAWGKILEGDLNAVHRAVMKY